MKLDELPFLEPTGWDTPRQRRALADHLRAGGPVWRSVDETGAPALGVYLAADIERVLRDAAFSMTKPDVPHTMPVTSDPPVHTRLRAALHKSFGPQRLLATEPVLAAAADRLVAVLDERVARTGHGDLMRGLVTPLCWRLFAEVLRFEGSDDERDGFIAAGVLSTDAEAQASRLTGDVAEAADAVLQYLRTVLDERAALPAEARGDDIVGSLVSANDLSPDERQGDLLFAMSSLTAIARGLLGVVAFTLWDRPETTAQLHDDVSLVPAFVDEVARAWPLGQAFVRRTRSEVTFHGVTVPAGTAVFAYFSAAAWDPAIFRSPDVLDLHRTDRHLGFAFGRGVHACTGATVARMLGSVIVTRLLPRVASWDLHDARWRAVELLSPHVLPVRPRSR